MALIKADLTPREFTNTRRCDAFAGMAATTQEVGGKTRVLCVSDRGADVHELFDAQR